MVAVGQLGAREGGDGHRAFALTVDLHEAVAQGGQGIAQVVGIHGAAAVDDGLEARHIRARGPHMLHQPVHHGGCGKQRELAHRGGQLHQFGGLEAARQGYDMARAAQHLGVVVQARAVRHGGCVDHGVARQDVVHVGEVAGRHGQQVAMGLHHALGTAGGA